MVTIMFARVLMVLATTLSCTRPTRIMWVVVIIVLLVVVGVREKVIGIMMGLLVVLRTKGMLWTDDVFVCRGV